MVTQLSMSRGVTSTRAHYFASTQLEQVKMTLGNENEVISNFLKTFSGISSEFIRHYQNESNGYTKFIILLTN